MILLDHSVSEKNRRVPDLDHSVPEKDLLEPQIYVPLL